MSGKHKRPGPSRLGGGTTLSGQYEEPIPPIEAWQEWAAQQVCLQAARSGNWHRADIEAVLGMLNLRHRIPRPPVEE